MNCLTFLDLIFDFFNISLLPFPYPTSPSYSIFIISTSPTSTCISPPLVYYIDHVKVLSFSHIPNLPQCPALDVEYCSAASRYLQVYYRGSGRTRCPQRYVLLGTSIIEDDVKITNLRLIHRSGRGVDICYNMESSQSSSTCFSLSILFCHLIKHQYKHMLYKRT